MQKHCGFCVCVLLLGVSFFASFCAKVDADRSDLSHLDAVRPRSNWNVQAKAVQNLVRRLFPDPDAAHLFNLTVDPHLGPKDRDTFHVVKSKSARWVNITGTSGVAAAWGLHYYLTQYCNCHVSWDYDQLELPSTLPEANITITSVDRFRYYQNVCTTSYSFVWWDWKRWERELDWMALNGINLALAFTGQEAVWRHVYLRLGLSKQDIDQHFSGPAFLAWQRMGNIRGWGGPLTDNWHHDSLLLQRQILQRMRSLGIIPVLPGFAGHVPRAFKRVYPNASTSSLPTWNRFPDQYCCPLLLEPTDPLFHKVGTQFTREIIARFGTDHIYNYDTFNEMTPHSGEPEYLAKVAQATFKALTDVDPKAIWMMQNWLFVHDYEFWTEPRAKAVLTSVPRGRLLVLDLMSELHPQYRRLKSYYGQPFIWCMLHNFGGTLGMYGAITNVNRNVFEARSMKNSTMVGTGLTMEGTGQNYVMYDFVNELSWRKEPANLTNWFERYASRRYGGSDINSNQAWQLLKDSVYSNTDPSYAHHGRFVITMEPSMVIQEPIWYKVEDVRSAWRALLAAAPSMANSSNYVYDLVDLSRQSLQLAGANIYQKIVQAFRQKQRDALKMHSSRFLELLSDLDKLLATDKHWILGLWLKSARERAGSQLEKSMFEWNARNQLTLWGPQGQIKDYAAKQWSGLISHYYRPRWERFLKTLEDSLQHSEHFNQTAVSQEIFKHVEEPFTLARNSFPTKPQGDAISIARRLFDLWSNFLDTQSFPQIRRRRPTSLPITVTPFYHVITT